MMFRGRSLFADLELNPWIDPARSLCEAGQPIGRLGVSASGLDSSKNWIPDLRGEGFPMKQPNGIYQPEPRVDFSFGLIVQFAFGC